MRFTIWIGAALLIVGADGALAAEGHLAEGTCEALWPIMAPDGLTLSEDNVGPFIVDFTKIDTNRDGLIDAAEFHLGCRAGLVKPPQPTEPRENAQSNSDPLTPLEPSIWDTDAHRQAYCARQRKVTVVGEVVGVTDNVRCFAWQ